jgi:hypothetical protein
MSPSLFKGFKAKGPKGISRSKAAFKGLKGDSSHALV